MYELTIVVTTDSDLISIGQGASINDQGYVGFVAESLNDSGERADNIYAFDPSTSEINQLIHPILMYTNDGFQQQRGATQSIFAEVQINNANQVLARRRLNVEVQIINPLEGQRVVPYTYLEIWDATASGNGLPTAQVAMSIPEEVRGKEGIFLLPKTAALLPSPLNPSTPYNDIFSASTINNLGHVNFSGVVAGASTNRVSSDKSGAQIGRGRITGFSIEPMLADNDWYVLTTSDSTIFVEPWDFGANAQALTDASFRAVSKAGISDDGQVIAFTADHEFLGQGLFVSTFDSTSARYRAPVLVLGLTENGVLDPGESFIDLNGDGLLDVGEDTGGFKDLTFDSRVGVNRVNPDADGSYLVAFKGTSSSLESTGLFTTVVSADETGRPTASPADLVLAEGNELDGLDGAIAQISLHDSVNQRGQLAFWVRTESDSAIVTAQRRTAPIRPGDFDGDGVLTEMDIDALATAVAEAANKPELDLSGDGVLSSADIHAWLDLYGTLNGDTNLDGRVDFSDFLILANNFGKPLSSWTSGNLDGSADGVQFADFVILAANFGLPLAG